MKISDFKLSENFLITFCSKKKIPFIDLNINFEEKREENKINIPNSKSLYQTLLSIISEYLENISDISGCDPLDPKDIKNLLITAVAMIRAFIYTKDSSPTNESIGFISKIRQFPFEWLFMRNIIVPSYDAPLKDITVVIANSAEIDVARYFPDNSELKSAKLQPPLILLNREVSSSSIKSAYLLFEFIRYIGLDPQMVVHELLGDPDLKDKTYGFSRMYFVDENITNEFIFTLGILSGDRGPISLDKYKDSNIWYKGAQAQTGQNTGVNVGWFFPQVIESLLDQDRGPDYSVQKALDPYIDSLWERVEKEKKRRGKSDMSLENLLIVQSEGMRPEKGQILQGLLQEQRIW